MQGNPKGTRSCLRITENDPIMNCISPIGDTLTCIEIKPAGTGRTKIRVVSKRIGFIYDSWVRKIENQRSQELQEILQSRP